MSMHQRTLILESHERLALEHARDCEPRAYLREQAAALLKIADGQTAHQVARTGLLKPRQPKTVYRWLNAFVQQRHLQVRPACRRAFSPTRHTPRPDR